MHEYYLNCNTHLAPAPQQLIVDGEPRHPLGLTPGLGLGEGQESNEICGALIAVEDQAAGVKLLERLCVAALLGCVGGGLASKAVGAHCMAIAVFLGHIGGSPASDEIREKAAGSRYKASVAGQAKGAGPLLDDG